MRTLVVMPTYNERENLPNIVSAVLAAAPVDVLVVDDGSPDGTGQLADEMAVANTRVKVLHGTGKAGLGAAYRRGFTWGLTNGYEALIEMDADGSHQPKFLPALIAGLDDHDLVIGSRWIAGGSVVNWPWHRKVLSVGGNLYARILLGLSVHDATAGFRAFRAETIGRLRILQSTSTGYVFQVDSSFRAAREQMKVLEVPIEFVERVVGVSKMSRAIVLEAMWQVTKWAWHHRILRKPLD